MEIGIIVTAVVLPVAFVLVLIAILRCFCSRKGPKGITETTRITSVESLQSGIAKLHVAYETNNPKNTGSFHNINHHDIDSKKRVNYYVLRRELSMKPYFNWADHPSLVSEAVEHGWSRFAFHGQNMASPSTRSKLLALCVSGDQVRESGAEISWEIGLGSAEFMQKVRLNSGLKRGVLDTTPPLGVSCVTQTALPLPGPYLGNSSFPQEAYFEITILSSREGDARKGKERKGEGEKSKLIQQVVNADVQQPDELKLVIKEDGRSEPVLVSMGLSVGGSHPQRLPGSYFGSIGLNSDGSVYLDGIKLVFEADKAEWGSIDTVIGCGFDPNQKKVFFTLNSELMHVINCKSDEFGRPLYPTLAANIDVTLLINVGQSTFKYAPANVHRTPNPCFIATAATLGYEDSRELFSMGRIDSEWLNRSTTKSCHNTINSENRKYEIDEESETDLFEIALDNTKRSPGTNSLIKS